MAIENLETYLNINGFPIIRRCQNCVHYNQDNNYADLQLGYCKLTPMYFAFTLQPNVYPLTKEFYLCESHAFTNEEKLAQNSQKVMLKDILKDKDELKKQKRR